MTICDCNVMGLRCCTSVIFSSDCLHCCVAYKDLLPSLSSFSPDGKFFKLSFCHTAVDLPFADGIPRLQLEMFWNVLHSKKIDPKISSKPQ